MSRRLLALALPALLALAGSATAEPRPPRWDDGDLAGRGRSVTSRPAVDATLTARPVRGAAPSKGVPRGPALSGDWVSRSDSFLVAGWAFQDLAGNCSTRGWVGTDRTSQLYAHVSDRYVVNQPFFTGRRPRSLRSLPAPLDSLELLTPRGLCFNAAGRLVFSEILLGDSAYRIYEIDLGSRTVSLFATPPEPTLYVNGYSGLQLDRSTGDLIGFSFGDSSAKIVRFPAAGGVGVVIAGDNAGSPDDTTGLAAFLGTCSQISVDAGGNIYFAEIEQHRVRVLRTDGRVVTLAGTGTPGGSGNGGPALAAQLDSPFGVVVDSAATVLYISDQSNSAIRRLDLLTGVIDAVPSGEPLTPTALAIEAGGLLVSTAEDVARVVRLAGGDVTTLAGGGRFGQVSDPPLATEQDLIDPRAITPDGAGGFYVLGRLQRLFFHVLADGRIEALAGVPGPLLRMGDRALRVGADMTSAPGTVGEWVREEGYGNGWSQRLTSPELGALTSTTTLSFDAWLDLNHAGSGFDYLTIEPGINEFLRIQILDAGGIWRDLGFRSFARSAGREQSWPAGEDVYGRNLVSLSTDLALFGNAAIPLGPTTRLRIVVQTNATGSDEDALSPPSVAAALLDNITLREGAVDVLPPVDFEDGTTGGWTLSALNGAYGSGGASGTRDIAPPATTVALRQGWDFSDPSCAWTFASAGDQVAPGAYASLASPWFAVVPGDTGIVIRFSGKLNGDEQGRFLQLLVRGKNAGDDRVRTVSQSSLLYSSGTIGGDGSVPFIDAGELRYPEDFQQPRAYDSLQVVFLVEDRGDQTGPLTLEGRPATRYPYFDDIAILQLGVDRDHDGIADAADAAPDVTAAGQDADADGAPDPYATLHHVESWSLASRPVAVAYSSDGLPGVTDSFAELDSAFAAWRAVPGADVPQTRLPDTAQQIASPLDGVNLVTFQDNTYPFSPEVLAVTPTLSATRRTTYGDRIVLPGEIVDADVLFNPAASFATPTRFGAYDLRSVATHEFGHLLGLSHSGVADATMYFVQQQGTEAASLADDDRAAIACAYPGPTLGTDFGTLFGTVTRDTLGGPIPGALVTAVRLDEGGAPIDTVVSDYTDESGAFRLHRLTGGLYGLHIQALDGVVLNGLQPAYISARLDAMDAVPFEAEWFDPAESARDDPAARTILSVSAGASDGPFAIITNLDTLPPAVTVVNPADGATDVRIDAAVQVGFNKPIDGGSLSEAFGVYRQGASVRLGGQGLLSNGGRTFLFASDTPLEFATAYEVRVTIGLRDQVGQHPAADFTSTFTTGAAPPLAIDDIRPRSATRGALFTVIGAGFDPTGIVQVVLEQGAVVDTVPAASVTSTSLAFTAPPSLLFGPYTVRVVVNSTANVSGPFEIEILPPAPQASPTPSGAPIALGWAPSDVAVSADALTVFAVGDGGLATVNLDPANLNAGPLRSAVQRLPGRSRAIALAPDGTRAYVTQPLDSLIVVVDADPGSGAFGLAIARVPLAGQPTGIAMAPSGLRVFAGDPGRGLVYEIDADPTSLTPNTLLRERNVLRDAVAGASLTDGIAVDPRNDRLLLTSSAGGFSFRLADSAVTVLHPAPGLGGIATDAGGTRVLFPSGGGELRIGPPASNAVVGGQTRDVEVTPQGQSAYVVNSTLNLLQVVNIDSLDPGYRKLSAQVGTGSAPVALDLSAGGSLIAVANRASGTISLYQQGATSAPVLTRLVPNVALPGDLVAAQGDETSGFVDPTQADLGFTTFPVGNPQNDGAGFRLPETGQRSSQLSLERGDGQRTLALPLTIVDRIRTLAPRPAFTFPVLDTVCAVTPVVGKLSQVRISPDGRLLAVSREAEPCQWFLDLYSLAADGSRPYGSVITSIPLSSGDAARTVNDIAFTPDLRRAWVPSGQRGAWIVDIDASSPTYGQVTDRIGLLEFGITRSIATDPLGRFMAIAAGSLDPGLQFWNLDGTLNSVTRGFSPVSVAATGDGRYLFAAGGDSVVVVDAASRAVVAARFFSDLSFGRVAISSDGRRGVAVDGGTVAVFNLDPQAGPLADLLYLGAPTGWSTLVDPWRLAPAPDGTGILAGFARRDTLYHLDLAVVPPVVSAAPLGLPDGLFSFDRTPDGRTLVASGFDPATGFGDTPRIQAFTLSEASAMALVSGDGQQAFPGQIFPLPARVRVTGTAGRPEAGVLVSFSLIDAGQGDLEGAASPLLLRTDTNGEAAAAWRVRSGTAPGAAVRVLVQALGIGAPEYVVTGTVAASDADIPPIVTQLSPGEGAAGLNASTPVAVRFNQRMTPGVGSFVLLKANGNPVAGTFTQQDDGRALLFQPQAPLPFAAACSLVVRPGATDTDGQTLAAGAGAAFTVQEPPTVAINALIPPSGPKGAPVTVSGTGFAPFPSDNTVLFNGVLATVSGAGATSLTATVPLAASSGPVTITAGGSTSAGFEFVVLPPNPDPGGVVGDLPSGEGSREMVLTPDGRRAYVTNPTTQSVTVLDLVAATTLTNVTVGLRPLGAAVLASPLRVYVANSGSDDVSVIDADSASADYNRVIRTIPVGDEPVDVVVSGVGPRIYVVNRASESMSVIDGNPGNATYDQVVTTIKTGSGGQAVAISPDGTTAYVASTGGLIVVDLLTQAVVTTVKTGSGGQAVAISPDGTLAFVLTTDGQLVVVNVAPGPGANTVVTTVKTGSGGQAVAISPDGTLAYVTNGDGNQVLVFEISRGSSASSSTVLPGPAVTLRLVATLPVGQAPAGVSVDPTGRSRVYVVNSGTGTVTVLGTGSGLPPLSTSVSFDTNVMDPKDYRSRVAAFLEPPAGSDPAAIDVGSLRVNGTVPPDPSIPPAIDDFDGDGRPELRVYFPRLPVWSGLPDGDAVPVELRGLLGGREIVARTTARVRGFQVIWPAPDVVLPSAQKLEIRWEPPANIAGTISILVSDDRGETWSEISYDEENDGAYDWVNPPGDADSLKIAVMLIYQNPVPPLRIPPDGYPEQVLGVIAESGFFSVRSLTDVEPAPAVLSFAPPHPNPARGVARLRFGLPGRTQVSLEIFDLQGRKVRVLANGERAPGWHVVSWRGEGDGGERLGPGLYFARFRAGGLEFRQRIVMLR